MTTSPNQTSRGRPVVGLRVVLFLLGAGLLAPPVQAQYFGRNKVQYEDLDFRVLRAEHFDIYFYPEEQVAAEIAARDAERWYRRFSTYFDHKLSGRQAVILYASAPAFQQTNAIEGSLGEGTGGVTEALRRRIVMPVGGTPADLDHVLGHELVHAFQYDITGTGRTATGAVPGVATLPLWFVEGMAEYLSIGPVSPLTAMWMRGAVQDKLPSYNDLHNPNWFPYRYGQALLAYVAGQWGDPVLAQLLRTAGRTRNIDLAITQVLRISPDSLVARWHAETRQAYEPLLGTTREAGEYGPLIVGSKGRESGVYNVSPAISPDGERLAFLSDRNLFSIDLFLADARTGEVRERLTKTDVDPHYQSLQFIQSAGSWSADGRRFAFAGIADGRPVISIRDLERKKTEREIRLKQVDEVYNPAWSPDGQAIVFSGVVGGLTDLFVYDLAADSLRRLTDDPFADLQPAWSPDGRTIVWASDRFRTSIDSLTIGPFGLVTMDAAGGVPRALPALGPAEQHNPQWAPDGASIYFIADRGGIPNVYRLSLADGRMFQVTDLYTGVAGITLTSPALSVAQQSGRVVYTVFRNNGYEIYGIDDPAARAGTPVEDPAPSLIAATLPPMDRSRDLLVRLLEDPSGTPPPADEASLPIQPYRPGLSLLYVGQPSLIAGSNQFGTYVGGGAALYFSDLLGNHVLVTALQVNGGLNDITAVVAYLNRRHRLNWTVGAQQIPYLSGGYASGIGTIDGEPVFIEQQLLQRQINRDVYGSVAYPFSTVQRVELQGGYTNISFQRELRTNAFSLVTGEQIVDQKQDLDVPPSLNLGLGSAALVYDNSFFGATAPILGQRYRFELGGAFGSINYASVLADYRRYFLPVRPFTFGVRLLHYGRYTGQADDIRLQPLFLGDPGLVRGYSYGSFDASECRPPASDPFACPVFDQLLGSRILVANAELRFPLFGVLGIGSGYYGSLPLDFVVFGDAGVAWNTEEDPSFIGNGTRDPVYSAGGALRFNLLGFAVIEAALVRPFDRPAKGWVWQFEFQPGF